MENETLKSMLNKIVEYNNPEVYGNFKAFLYENTRGYYFKVVEIISGTGTGIAFNDIIYLKDGDENYLVVADKPKLMRISKKSWHYRLLQYILRDNAPTPKDMQNGCPYFWLLIFSILVVPFVALFQAFVWIILLIPKMVFWVLEKLVMNWIASLDDESAYEINRSDYKYNKSSKMPKTARLFFNKNDNDFFTFFLSKKYDIKQNDPNYIKKMDEIKMKWEAWRDELDKKSKEENRLNVLKQKKLLEKQRIQEKKREASRLAWEARMKPIRENFAEIGEWFRKTFTVERGRRNNIVKRTKQFVGALITAIILTATFFVVNYVSLALMATVDWCIAHWEIFFGLALGVIFCFIVYLLSILISSWGQSMVDKYKRGKKIWYVEPFIYLVWYPVKYLLIDIVFIVVKIN